MSYDAVVYRILIASPSDITEEREAISNAVHSWNAANSQDLKTVLLPIRWETNATPGMGDRPQAMLNEQLVNPSDILIGIFWTRIGTDTGTSESGTIEEIEAFIRENKPVLTYFSKKLMPHNIDPEQFKKVKKFQTEIIERKLGLFDTFSTNSELENKLGRHLIQVVRELKSASSPGTSPKNAHPATVTIKHEISSSTPPEQLDEQILTRINHALKTDGQRLLLLAFLNPSTKSNGGELEMESEEIRQIANNIAQKNQKHQISKISGVLSGFTQKGELKKLEILCKGRKVRGGSIYSMNVKWLPYLRRIQLNLNWKL